MTERQHAPSLGALEGLEEIVQRAPAALLVVREDATVAVANPHAEALFGKGTGELVGRSVRDLQPVAKPPRSPELSKMNHELRTPLNAILGFAQLLQWDEGTLTEKQLEMVEHIQKGGEALLALLDGYFDSGE